MKLAPRLLPLGRASSASWRNPAKEPPGLLEQGPGSSREQERDQLLCRSIRAAGMSLCQLEQQRLPRGAEASPQVLRLSWAGLGRGCEHPGGLWGLGWGL